MSTKCAFCKSRGELHEVEAPAIRLCIKCREKLSTHIAVICTNCDTLYWLQKSAGNAMTASEMSELPLQHIMDNYLVHEIKSCRRCYEGVKGFPLPAVWVQ